MTTLHAVAARKRLLIADDHELMLAGVAQILSTEFDVVGSAADGSIVLAETARLKPDLIVLDIGMPEVNGIDATRKIIAMLPKTRIIVLTQQISSNHVMAAFRAGAHGFVAKQSAATELIDAAHAVLLGRFYLTPLATPGKPRSGVMDRNPADLFREALTPRQREVLKLVAHGKSAKEIASSLVISVKTVDFHKGILMDSLGLRTTAELTRYAILNGIVSDS